MQKLPIGIQSFEDIREENYLYVDKTKQILLYLYHFYFVSPTLQNSPISIFIILKL